MQGSVCCWAVLLVVCFASAEIQNSEWWKTAVFYQIYPRSFKDSNGDGVGDLNGITSKLEYIAETGIDAIWISPIFSSPMVDFGYDISNYTEIDYRFGTLEDFQALIARAHELDIKVILDFVPNHTSDKHEWFQSSVDGVEPYKDYYVWREGKNNNTEPPNNWISVFGGSAWKWREERGQWYLHQFEYRQPDLNFYNRKVRDELADTLKFWLKQGVDGFRTDAAPYYFEDNKYRDEPRSNKPGVTDQEDAYLIHTRTKDNPQTYLVFGSWVKLLDKYADEHNEDKKVMMSEAYTNLTNTMKFYKFGSDVPFNFGVITDLDASSKPSEYKQVADTWLDNMPSGAIANWVVGNHDNSRVASRFPGRSDQMTMLVMILPGVAVTYNGEEIGMVDKTDISWEDTQDPQACNAGKEKYQKLSRDPSRTPFQWDDTENAGFSTADSTWLPVNENYKELNLANQEEAQFSHYKIYRSLIALRKSETVLQEGETKIEVLNEDKVLAVIRENSTKSVALVINFLDDESQTVDLAGVMETHNTTKVAISSLDSGVEPETEVDASNVTLPAKASLILVSEN